MKRLLALLLLTASTLGVSAQKTVELKCNADEVIRWWDNRTAPHSNGETEDEAFDKKGNVIHSSETAFYLFKADEAVNTRRSVVIFPGGGYYKLSINFRLAEWFAKHGVTAMFVKYRLPNGVKEVPLEDAQAAMGYLRKHAKRLNIDPSKVGVCGNSAGGHLAAYVSNFTPDNEKPAWAILFYPVITEPEWHTHNYTFRNLLGKERTPAEKQYYALENRVTSATPPTMILVTDDDTTVPNISSLLYYEALKRHGVKAAMHIYPSGGHGWAGRKGYIYRSSFLSHIEDWLAELDEADNKTDNTKK